ncbi:UNVERIFIED_CONTAM: hypothetical protein Sradi_0920400 [Sesamum radiatum]|uniref:Uncharacterized protein n=1 Tax=Sesamum radiatum TaxID=300843 RepID=A0AAW2V650_SESRA
MLATFLASTPLLEESWRLCSHANAVAQRSFAVSVVGQVAYVAFSAVQVVESAGTWGAAEMWEGNLGFIPLSCGRGECSDG